MALLDMCRVSTLVGSTLDDSHGICHWHVHESCGMTGLIGCPQQDFPLVSLGVTCSVTIQMHTSHHASSPYYRHCVLLFSYHFLCKCLCTLIFLNVISLRSISYYHMLFLTVPPVKHLWGPAFGKLPFNVLRLL